MFNFIALFDSSSSFIFIILLFFLLIFSMTGRNKIDKSRIKKLPKKEFLDTKRMGTLVDIRKDKTADETKMVGAKLFPGKSGAKDSRIRKDIPIFIYDQNGKKAYSVAKEYVKNGATMVYYLDGGLNNYLGIDPKAKNKKD